MDATLEKSILQTLAYFQVFNFPLTAWEIYKNLYLPPNLTDFSAVLKTLNRLTPCTLQTQEGFYFLPGQNQLVSIRKKRYRLAQKKIQNAKPYLRLIRRLPFIQGVFLCNNLAYQNAPWESDVDLIILTAPGRLWSARFFSTGLIKLLNKRPGPRNQRNKICLSFYLSQDNLNLQSLAYPQDIHLVYWLNQFLPLYEAGPNLGQAFYQANRWTGKFLPNFFLSTPSPNWTLTAGHNRKKTPYAVKNSWPGKLLERTLKSLQLKIMPPGIKKLSQENNTNVILNDKILKFHTKDRRLAVQHQWQEICKKVLK